MSEPVALVLTRKQLSALESLARPSEMTEYWGNWSDELQVARGLEAKGLVVRTRGELPPWSMTVLGKQVLRESIERAEGV